MQDKSWVLIWELRELALNGSCREAMLEGGAVSILAALIAEEDMPAPAKANAAAALKVWGRMCGLHQRTPVALLLADNVENLPLRGKPMPSLNRCVLLCALPATTCNPRTHVLKSSA